jgi:hypothetical protein
VVLAQRRCYLLGGVLWSCGHSPLHAAKMPRMRGSRSYGAVVVIVAPFCAEPGRPVWLIVNA